MAMPRPRNPFRDTRNVNLSARAYDQFTRAHGQKSTQDAFDRLVAFFMALPPDAREILLSRVSKPNQIRVLRAIIRKLQDET